MADILSPNPTIRIPLTRTQIVDMLYRQAADAKIRAYRGIRRQLFGPGPDGKAFTPSQIAANWAEWAVNTKTKLNPEQLGQNARITKAEFNMFCNDADTIVDEVPEATITF